MSTKQKAIDGDYLDSFSIKLRELLKKCNYTQTKFAKEIGVSYNSVNKWINKKSKPKWLLELFAVMQFFYGKIRGFNPMQLFYIEDFDLTLNNGKINSLDIEKVIEERVDIETKKLKDSYEMQIEQIRANQQKEMDELKRLHKEEIEHIKARYNCLLSDIKIDN